MVQGYVIASAVIGTLCVIGFLGVWYWFPRAFAWGYKQEMKAMDAELAPEGATHEEIEEARAARTAMSRGIVQRALAREQALKRGETPSDEPVVPREYYERNPQFASYPPPPTVAMHPAPRHEGDDGPPAYNAS